MLRKEMQSKAYKYSSLKDPEIPAGVWIYLDGVLLTDGVVVLQTAGVVPQSVRLVILHRMHCVQEVLFKLHSMLTMYRCTRLFGQTVVPSVQKALSNMHGILTVYTLYTDGQHSWTHR